MTAALPATYISRFIQQEEISWGGSNAPHCGGSGWGWMRIFILLPQYPSSNLETIFGLPVITFVSK